MKTRKITALALAAAMTFSAMSAVSVYADDSAAALEAEKTINVEAETVYTAADLCPDGASYLKTISSWSAVDSANYSSFSVDFGDITSYNTYAVNGLNTELSFNAPVDGIYQLSLLSVTDYWWQYPAVYVNGTNVSNGTDGGFANKSELASTIATFDAGKAAIAKAKLNLSEGDNAIRLTSGGSYEGLTGLVAVKLTLLSKSTFTTDEIIKGDNITRGANRTSYCHTVDGGYTATDAYTGEVAEVFGDAANIGDKYNNYTDDTSTYSLDVKKAGKYKVYVLGVSGNSTKFTYTDKNGVAETVSATTAWTNEYWTTALFTGGGKNVNLQVCEVELEATKYAVSVEKADGANYFTDFVALGMKLVEAAEPELTLPEVEVAEFGSYASDSGNPAKAYTGTFTVAEGNVAVSGVEWTVGEASATSTFDTVISSGTVITGLVVTAADLTAIPAPAAVAVAAE